MSNKKYHPEIEFIDPKQLAEDILNDKLRVNDDIAIVDVRDNDFVGGNVTGVINSPSKKYEDEKQELYNRVKDKKRVIFYCGSSTGRGPRIAGFYKDFLNQRQKEDDFDGNKDQKVEVLSYGFKAWYPLYKDETKLVENFDPLIWDKNE
ncbi:Rhodanese-like protein [Neoconidiobolus thromboides FSU 785]|nr:Rhodanese-like protein [Neoconidiobolus thromboides FSU 785]